MEIKNLLSGYQPEDKYKGTEKLLLESQLSRLEGDLRKGLVTPSQYRIELNRIENAILSLVGHKDSESKTSNSALSEEDVLAEMIKVNKRRRPEIATEAGNLLDDIAEYRKLKRTLAAHDPSGRRWSLIMSKLNGLIEKESEAKKDSIEVKTEKILSIIEEIIPDYDKLEEAFGICKGLGMNNALVETTLESKPDDTEAKILVAENIEAFVRNLKLK